MAIYERRKTVKDLATFSIRIPPELKKTLEDMAHQKRKSLGMMVGEILAESVRSIEQAQ